MPLEHYFTNNPNLKSELRKLTYNYKDVHFEFFSDNGVFSKNKVDFASKLLVETFLDTTRDVRDFKMLEIILPNWIQGLGKIKRYALAV